MRLVSAQSGTIEDNVLKGGTTEFIGGPWQFVGNTYLGTVPDTYTDGVIAGHFTHDVTIANNFVESTGPSGKTYRFLVLTQGGVDDVIQNNTVIGVGPMDDDTVPDPNASEVILTESYRLHYEGMVSNVSPDGWVVQIPTPQGGAANTGDVLAILSGPQAGQWRMIVQALGPDTYLLDAPITPGSFAVSITQAGFVNETFAGNTVDARGSSTATDLVLAGNNFGTQVVNNTLLGAARAPDRRDRDRGSRFLGRWSCLFPRSKGTRSKTRYSGPGFTSSTSWYTCPDIGRVYWNRVEQHRGSGPQACRPGVYRWSDESPRDADDHDLATADPGEMILSVQGNQGRDRPA